MYFCCLSCCGPGCVTISPENEYAKCALTHNVFIVLLHVPVFMRKITFLFAVPLCFTLCSSCHKDVKDFTYLNFSIAFDPMQDRLDNQGNPAPLAAGHGAQSPDMENVRIQYIEFVPDANTAYKDGEQLFKANQYNFGGTYAIYFDSTLDAVPGGRFYSLNLKRLPAGTYRYVRVHVSWQHCMVQYDLNNVPGTGTLSDLSGDLACTLGDASYYGMFAVGDSSLPVNAVLYPGVWKLSAVLPDPSMSRIIGGQCPPGNITEVNPLYASSPVPPQTNIVTAAFDDPLVLADDETRNLNVTLTLSVNQSIEWDDSNGNGAWDVDYTGSSTEPLVDVGIRGMTLQYDWTN